MLKLTLLSGDPVLVRANKINIIFETELLTIIIVDGEELKIKESAEQIISAVNGFTNEIKK